MTKEEAIHEIEKVFEPAFANYIITALTEGATSSEEEQQPCEDCISREEAKQFLYERIDRLNDDELYDIFSRIIDDIYNELPSVTPRPKGKWIGHKKHCENLGVMPSGLGAYNWCSNCDCGIDVMEFHKNHYNYCPNCGAKMESEDKE